MKKCLLSLFVCALLIVALIPAAVSESRHYMGTWHYLPEGIHWAKCTRCDTVMVEKCDSFSFVYDGIEFAVCPICGHCGSVTGKTLRPSVLVYDYSNSPVGDLLMMEYDAPFADKNEVKAAYSVIFEYAGRVMDFDGVMDVTFPFRYDEQFNIVKVYDDIVDDVPFEYDSEAGLLTFTVTGGSGLFMIYGNE